MAIVGEPTVDAQAGTITFTVRGISATPAEHPDGDTSIEAVLNDKVCGTVPAIVVVPSRIKAPFPEADGQVTPENVAINRTTSPALFDVKPPHKGLVTLYGHELDITIQDQFGNDLDGMYQGAEIQEIIRGVGRRPINRTLDAQGTYEDPVGLFATHIPRVVVHQDSDAAQQWPNESPLPMSNIPAPKRDHLQTFFVVVGGHTVQPQVRRRVTGTLPDRIQIIWPTPDE